MATCTNCSSLILFGGKRHGNLRFCGDDCLEKGRLQITAQEIPAETVEATARELHSGLCPRCGGSGPVDLHTSHEIWSLILMTRWQSVGRISCRGCGVRQQLGGLAFSTLFGWWGFPWGIFMTPVQIVRNAMGLASPPDATQPSDRLREHVRMMIAEGAEPDEA